MSEEEIIQLKPFEGSVVNFRINADITFDIEDLFDGELIPGDMTAEKLVEWLKAWFGRSKSFLMSELGLDPEIHVSIDDGVEAEFK